eukprot:PITA_20542
MCYDYRALNKQTVRNRYPLPLAIDCFEKLAKARFFSKLDLRHGYYQVQIAKGDKKKTAIVTSDNMEDHKKNLVMVFEALRANQLYLKKSKCVFAQTEIPFLGHIVGQGYIWMDPSRVEAIKDSVEPKNAHEMRVFLGMTKYQRKFEEGYSKVTSSLTDLFKKDKRWSWTNKCQEAFDDLKRRIVTTLILKLPDFERPFEVHTDASYFTIGGILMQDGHPVEYESRKF